MVSEKETIGQESFISKDSTKEKLEFVYLNISFYLEYFLLGKLYLFIYFLLGKFCVSPEYKYKPIMYQLSLSINI